MKASRVGSLQFCLCMGYDGIGMKPFSTPCAGVKPERLAEGMEPRHCALSLVGEPIMYPEINTLVDELHRRHISSFLVTNAQFPDRISQLKPVTQARYISACFCDFQKSDSIGLLSYAMLIKM